MGASEDYAKRGGLAGIAKTALQRLRAESESNKAHAFYGAFEALDKGDPIPLVEAISALPDTAENGAIKTVFTLAAFQSEIRRVKEELKTKPVDAFEDTDPQIFNYASMEAADEHRQSSAAQKPRKKDATKEAVIGVMKNARKHDYTFKGFLNDAEGGHRGVTIKRDRNGTYWVDCEDADNEKNVSEKTLMDWWTEAK